jgi:hypothetical protein
METARRRICAKCQTIRSVNASAKGETILVGTSFGLIDFFG